MSWTDQKVEKLKELWGKGNTASQIAEILGGVSRNAVIGKAHRLNLSAKIKTRPATSNASFDNSVDKNPKIKKWNKLENSNKNPYRGFRIDGPASSWPEKIMLNTFSAITLRKKIGF